MFGKYKLISLLGRGGMGEVFLARGPQLKRPVVIKRILASMLSEPDMLRAFLDETRIAARLRHPNIVRIDELGEVEGEWFVRMEYVEGAALSEVLKRAARGNEHLPLEAVLSMGAGLASALDYAHHATDPEGRALQIVHRDVTPQNVLLARSGEVKLIDFGVARAEQRFLRTMPGMVKGKLPYMSPEQADGRRIDARSDIFALGVCMWESLTGRRLFRGATQAETMQKIFACQVSPPSLFRPEVPPEVDALVLKALSRDVANRFKRAADLGEAIDTVVEQYALPSGAKAIAALTRKWVPESGHAEGLAPDEEVTGTVEKPGTDVVTRHERPGARPKWPSEAALTMVEEEPPAEAEEGQVPNDAEALIGRAAELADLHQLIGSGERLVTLLGPGGVGKSRLAREAARQQVSKFRGRVWVADLTAAKSVEGLCLIVSESLGVALPAGSPVEAVGVLLTARRECLLVLDNVEQLAKEIGPVVSAWHAAARDAHFLLCSRVVLGVESEKKYEVGPLPFDSSGDDEGDAMRLFLERVRVLNPHFPTGRWARDMVRELVRRLDGMPLAIELAAAQMADAPLDSLRETARLQSSAGGSGQFVAIDQAFEASWNQLTDEERAALAQCTVFVSGFAAGAALDVLRLPGHPGDAHREAVLQVLHRLRSRSLLRVSFPLKSDQARYGMYESIRARVLGRLPQEEGRAKKRHASWYLRLGETLGPAAERGAAVLDLLASERDNLMASWEWWLGQGGDGVKQALRVVLALDALFLVRGPYGAHLSMLDAVLEKLKDPADRAPGLEARARVLLSRGRLKEAASDLEAVLAQSPFTPTAVDGSRQDWPALGKSGGLSPEAAGRALAYLASVRKQEGALPEAQELYERALTLLKETKDVRMQGRVYANMGALAQEQGRLDDAEDLSAAALKLHRLAQDRRFEGVTLSNLAVLQQARGEWAAAEESCTNAIAVHRELGNRRSEGIAVTNFADLERDRGGTARAMALYRRAVVVHREVGNRRFEAVCLLNQALLMMEQSTFEPAAEALDEALGLFHVVGDKRHAGLTLGARGAMRAKRGDVSAGEGDFRAAKELLGEKDLAFSSAVDVYRAQVELSEAEVLEAAKKSGEATKKRQAAAARIEAAVTRGPQGSLAERFEHVRMALRVLKVWTERG
ncbi:MAG: protein kinase [Archangium sp.]|nr:protein kinase [Archangium sp.]